MSTFKDALELGSLIEVKDLDFNSYEKNIDDINKKFSEAVSVINSTIAVIA